MNEQIKGKRFNKGKLRYELISGIALKEIAKVYTNGAEKYTERNDNGDILFDGSNNWRNGLSWMDCIASAKRHIEKFINGVDIDDETKTLHVANACWNLMTIIDFYNTFPQGDDRPKRFLNQPKIGLDIDGVISNLTGAWNNRYPEIDVNPSTYYFDKDIMSRFKKMKEDNDLDNFYLDLEPLITADEILFEPHCYVTARPVDTEITKEWLAINGFPNRKVITVPTGTSKVDVMKEAGIEIFIDDYYGNFIELNNIRLY